MKTLRRAATAAVLVSTALVTAALPASAATGSWTITQNRSTLYFDGDGASGFFQKPQTQLPANGKITSTSYSTGKYKNGYTREVLSLCYRQQYASVDYLCKTITPTNGATVSTADFNGLDPKGAFFLRYQVFGGTYPASGTGVSDTVTVAYQY